MFGIWACKTDTPETEKDPLEEKEATLLLLDSLIAANPKNPDYYYDRALYYKQEGVGPKAMSDIYSALFIDSLNVDYYLFAGDLFLELGDGNKAVATMSKAIHLIPENELLQEKAIEYNFYMKNYESALNFTNDLIKLNKYNANAYLYKGLIYKDLKDNSKAISAFQTCIEVNPNFYDAHMQLGLLYSELKNDLAVQYFENALKIDDKSREAAYAIAYHYQRKKEFKKAVSQYKAMIVDNPKDHEVFFNLGHCYIAQDSLDKAYKHFDLAIKIHPQYAGAYYMKGNVSEMMGNNADALSNYKQAQAMLPNDETIAAAIVRVQ